MSTQARVSTSMLVAAAELLAVRDGADRDGVRARLARACLARCGAAGARLLHLVDRAPGRCLLRLLEAATLPGIAAHYAWRKRRIRRWVAEEVAAGSRQLLVAGAGFDALGPEAAAVHPALRVFEVDRPGSVAIRRIAFRDCGIAATALHAADLATEGLQCALRAFKAAGFDRDAPTTVVAEGLPMYLPLPAVGRLVRDLRAGCRARVGVIATAMACDDRGAPRFHRQRPWLRGWLAQRGEAFAWGTTRAALPVLAGQCRVAIGQVADPDAPRDPDPCPGEWLFRGTLA